jgi:uncharacterized membrane protein
MRIIEKIKSNYWLILIIILGATLRFYHIDFQSIWLDEIHTMNESNPNIPFSELYNVIMSGEQMPPFYFYSLYFIFKIFGYTTFVARIYSAVLGVISLYSIYLLGKELLSKRIGLIAAFILSVNYFHLYYSQDARPYILLLLFSILSLYKMVVYIKNPSLKNALYYGFFAAMMINSHFFGLFALFAQYLILLLFLVLSEKDSKKSFFINSFISGLVTLILFIPAIKIFIKITEIKEFWIPAPTIDAYTLIFKEFFGNSELILILVSLFLLFYFIKVSKQKDIPITYKNIVENRIIFSSIIFIPWIVTIILIPLIRSYTSIPMIISRYFIVVLPVLILLISIGIQQFKNKVVYNGLLLLFLIFSIIDIVVVKKYYNSVNKAQFREATTFIKENINSNEPVVSSLGWYLPFFLKNQNTKQEIIDKSLELHIAEMQSDSTKIKPFWYIDGHGREYNPNDATLAFLNQHFYLNNNYDGFQAWTKHFILLKDVPKTIDISKYSNIQQINGDPFMYNIETFENVNNKVTTSGWAYFEKQTAVNTEIELIFIKDLKATRLLTQKVNRVDVTSYFKNEFNVDNCGFKSSYDLYNLESGKYQLAIYLLDKETKKEGLILSDKIIDIK